MPDLDHGKLNRLSQLNYGVDYNLGARLASGVDRDLNGISQQLYGKDPNGAAEQIYSLMGGRSIVLNGSTSFISTPDHASLDILGDIDLRIEVEHAGSNGQNQALISKAAGGGQWSYEWRLTLVGVPQLITSSDGTALITETLPGSYASAGTRLCLRVTADVDNGASGHTYEHYWGTSMAGPWTSFGSVTNAPATSLFSSTSEVRLGHRSGGGSGFNGKIFRAEIRNGINGTVVANPDFRFLALGATSVVDGTGKTWTITNASVV